MNGTGLSTGFFFFIGACLLITEINSDSKFSYAEFTLSHLSTIEFKFFCSKSFKKNSNFSLHP